MLINLIGAPEALWLLTQALKCKTYYTTPMIGGNRQLSLVANEPVEFEGKPVEVQDSRKITDHFRGIYRI